MIKIIVKKYSTKIEEREYFLDLREYDEATWGLTPVNGILKFKDHGYTYNTCDGGFIHLIKGSKWINKRRQIS